MFTHRFFIIIPILLYATSYVAAGCIGDLKAGSQSELDSIKSCMTYKGTITIENTGATDLKLDGIELLEGDLVISDNSALTRFTLPALEAVNGVVKFQNNKLLNTLDMRKLAGLRSFEISVHPALNLLSFPTGLSQAERFMVTDTTVTQINGLKLSSIGDMVISNNIYLKSLAVGNLTQLKGSLTVTANSQALNLDFSSLLALNDGSFRNLAGIDFSSLSRISGDISFISNTFSSLSLPKLSDVAGTLTLSNNMQLSNLSMPQLRHLGGALSLGGNHHLEVVDAFPSLEEVDGTLDLTGSFDDIQLPHLNDVRGGLNVQTSSNRFLCDGMNKLKSGVIKGNSFICKSGVAKPKSGLKGGGADDSGATAMVRAAGYWFSALITFSAIHSLTEIEVVETRKRKHKRRHRKTNLESAAALKTKQVCIVDEAIKKTPVNTGHSYANAAEDYEDREMWAKAAEAHLLAAEQFQKATEYTDDTEANRTLQLLTMNHSRKAKELQRKAAKAATEQSSAPTAHVVGGSGYRAQADGIDMSGLRIALPETRPREPLRQAQCHTSQGTIGDSYALLTENDDEDDSDPFNKFWDVVETLVEKLSNPVAFASAPLNENDNPTPAWTYEAAADRGDDIGDNDEEENSSMNHRKDSYAMMESYFVVPEQDALDITRTISGAGDEEKRTWQDYVLENEQLKKRIDQLLRKLQAMEKVCLLCACQPGVLTRSTKAAEESNVLKTSIIQFRNDVQKQAKRIMQNHDSSMRSSAALGSSGTHTIHNSYIRHPSNGNVTEMMARLKELEEENRQLRSHNEKQQVLMNKYRERWEKLKESAKKRRSQPSEQHGGGTPPGSSGSISSEYTQSRPPTLLRSLAQQPANVQSSYPPFAASRNSHGATDYRSKTAA
ncbi:hypothetical protein DFQ30_001109 [Apophysomyces sp. BC1015]|nr:hypothetical protein DFQ30_001109 [Apophysomyces sp. BC1015]